MEVKITVHTDHAAWEDSPEIQVHRVLDKIPSMVSEMLDCTTVLDSNGNSTARIEVQYDEGDYERYIEKVYSDQFMAPEYLYGKFALVETDGVETWIPYDCIDQSDTIQEIKIGYFWRLSAQGYLDCTEWYGPFSTLLDAYQNILENTNEYQ